MANISTPRLMELERAEKRLKQLEEQAAIKPFVDHLLHNVGTYLALTPFEKWPKDMQTIFHSVSRDLPTAAAIYRNNLPKAD